MRSLGGQPHWDDPASFLDSVIPQFALDKWAGQQYHVELWVEKDAQVSVLKRVSRALDVSYFACRGYVSQSEMHAAAIRLKKHVYAGRKVVIIYLGDHDPSGMDMSNDIENRIGDVFGCANFTLDRVALSMAQVRQFNLPPNPAKTSDKRAKKYIAEYGDESWELDALEPKYLQQLLTSRVAIYRDDALFNAVKERQEEMRDYLVKQGLNKFLADPWPSDIYDFLYMGHRIEYRAMEDVDDGDVIPRVPCGNPSCECDDTEYVHAAKPCESCAGL